MELCCWSSQRVKASVFHSCSKCKTILYSFRESQADLALAVAEPLIPAVILRCFLLHILPPLIKLLADWTQSSRVYSILLMILLCITESKAQGIIMQFLAISIASQLV